MCEFGSRWGAAEAIDELYGRGLQMSRYCTFDRYLPLVVPARCVRRNFVRSSSVCTVPVVVCSLCSIYR